MLATAFGEQGRAALTVRLLSLPLFLALWEAVVQFGTVNPILFPPPSSVLIAMIDYARSGVLASDVLWSLSRVAVGFIAGALLGVVLGVLTGTIPLASALFTPVFQLLRPIPPIAFVPVVIVWFGITELGKWFLVFWGVFFTVWMSAHLGVQRVNETLVRAAMCLGADRKSLLVEVVFPAALPFIFVGVRTAIGISFYTLVAAELAGASFGIAYRLEVTQQNMQIAQMMSGLILLGVISASADRLFGLLSARLVHWQT